jgi:hypothetical protein
MKREATTDRQSVSSRKPWRLVERDNGKDGMFLQTYLKLRDWRSRDILRYTYSSCTACPRSPPPIPPSFLTPFVAAAASLLLIPSPCGPSSAESVCTLSSHCSADTPPAVASACRTARRPCFSICGRGREKDTSASGLGRDK